MPTQQPTSTESALQTLHQAETKILSALTSASSAIRSLSPPTPSPPNFTHHTKAFLTDLHTAQALIRTRIAALTPDLPFETATTRRLIEADLAVQRTAHVHRSLVRTLAALDEAPVPGPSSAAASPNWMPSPVANTPLAALGGAVSSPPAAGAPITIAVPTPDAAAADLSLSAAVALNGGVVPEVEQLPESAAADADGPERMEL